MRGLMNSWAAISWFGCPSRASRAIWASWDGELGEGLDGALADGLPGRHKLAAGTLGEAVGADAAEHLVGRAQRFARVQAAVLAAQPFTVKEVGAGQVDDDAALAEPPDRLLVEGIGGLAVAQQRA